MSDFINTVDIIDDDILMDGLIERSISGSFNDNKITTIKNGAFAYCTNLESVCFPNVTTIGAGAFTGSGLKAITPDTFPSVTKFPYQYGPHTFSESALETVEWPSLTRLDEDKLFPNCTSLKSISLPNLSEIVGYGGLNLSGCTSLTDVNLPLITKGVDFSNCTSLETITLPLLQSVGGHCFNNCTSLRVIDLPSCTSMTGHSNFINCPFEALILRSATVCDLSQLYDTTGNKQVYSFRNSGLANGTGYVYVPRDLLDSYKAAIVWSYYPSQFRALEDYTVDGTTTGAMREHCESLALNATELTFTDANSKTLAITTQLDILDEITWTTSDKAVARVNNGVVTPVSDGTATITVTCREHSATCAVTVNAGLVAPVHVIELAPYNGSEEGELPVGKLDVNAGDVLEITYYLTKRQGYVYDGRNCGLEYQLNDNVIGQETTITVNILSNGNIMFSGHSGSDINNAGQLASYSGDRLYGKYLEVKIL